MNCNLPKERTHQCRIHSVDEVIDLPLEFSESQEYSIDVESAKGVKQQQRKRENNRLQSRLEELQRDVSQLTLKLRGSACEIEPEIGFTEQSSFKASIKMKKAIKELGNAGKDDTVRRNCNGERSPKICDINRTRDIACGDRRLRKQVQRGK